MTHPPFRKRSKGETLPADLPYRATEKQLAYIDGLCEAMGISRAEAWLFYTRLGYQLHPVSAPGMVARADGMGRGPENLLIADAQRFITCLKRGWNAVRARDLGYCAFESEYDPILERPDGWWRKTRPL